MSGMTKTQRAALLRLADGPKYGSGPVQQALVREGFATFFGNGAGTRITPAGRSALGLPPTTGVGE